jgi:segregation and condensation protein A
VEPLETTWDEVFEAALGVEMPIPRGREHRVTTRTVTMEEKAVLILDALKGATRVEFSRLLRGFKERSHGVMTFLAGLELTRRRLLLLRQTRPFAELWIYRREEGGAEGDGESDANTDTETEDEGARA